MRNTAVCLSILVALLIATCMTIYFSFYYAAKNRNQELGSYIAQNYIITKDPIHILLYK